MSWKTGLSRYLPSLRFFACPVSPSSRGVLQYYGQYYNEFKLLNPNMSIMLRTTENALPAITTELNFTTNHVLQYMIQNGKFRNSNGTLANERINAAIEYMNINWEQYNTERFRINNVDPEHPAIDILIPDFKTNIDIQNKLKTYFTMKERITELLNIIKSGPNNEYIHNENALLMCQRIDLWCSGPKEVEHAVYHLYQLGRYVNGKNNLEVEIPTFITEFIPGTDDMADI